MNGNRRTPRRGLGILVRTAGLAWLLAVVTLGIFIAVVVPSQRAAFLENLGSKAHGVSASLQDIAAGAAISEDYTTIVDHCTRVLAADSSISYIVLTRKDGFSLIHDRDGWRNDELGPQWLPSLRMAGGGIRATKPGEASVYHYSWPFDHSGIEWGWIHIGLSLQAYTENVQALYHRTSLAVVLCLVLGLLASVLYARRLTMPIVQLRQAVLRLAGGDLSVRAHVSSRDEVGELAESFNRMTESLLQRDMILQSVRFASQQFFAAENWRQAIDEVLRSLGQAADASRVYIFENARDPNGTLTTSHRHEWTAAHAPEIGRPALQNVRFEDVGLARWVPVLEAGHSIVGNIMDFPEEERIVWTGQGIYSIAVVPVLSGDRWWGFIGLDECRQPRVWSDAEIASLRATADTLGAAVERQLARDALLVAKNAAEAASTAKSQFLANMSHEIRTPISGVLGMLHLLQRTVLSSKQQRYVGHAVDAANMLLTVIGDVLDFSKIEAGRMTVEEATFSVPGMVDGAIRAFAERAETKGVELVYRLATDLPSQLRGDPARVRQILVNLIGNALKFTDRGVILVDCEVQEFLVEGVVLKFSVRDTGSGIAPDQQELVFDPFYQADGSMSRGHGGTGLGLSICRQLCELMGGAIGLTSEPGRGSTFWFTVQLKSCPIQATGTSQPLLGLKGLRALVVDDCPESLEVVSGYISTWKGVAEIASDAATGLEKLRAARKSGQPFKVAILDWKMPEVDGITMARLIKQDEEIRNTSLILLSSFGQPGDDSEVDTRLFSAAIPKPAGMSEMYDAIVEAANLDVGLRSRPTWAASKSQPAITPGVRGGVVLLVEDNEINREVAGDMIIDLGYQCICARNGREAVDAVKAGQAHLVLMDCQMPVMDGYEATRVIRQWEETRGDRSGARRLPVIALTAHAMKEDRDICLQNGMDDFLAKPLDPDQLAAALHRWMRSGEVGSADPGAAPGGRRLGEAAAQSGGPETGVAGCEPLRSTPTCEPLDFPDLVKRCMGKVDLAQRLLQKFMTLVRPYTEEIGSAVRRGDPVALEAGAHRLKGAAASVSARAVSRIAGELEVLGKSRALASAPGLVDQLKEQVERLVAVHGRQ